MQPEALNGIFPPIVTPFTDGRVDLEKLAANIERWRLSGLHGLVVLGSNGEYPLLTWEEKLLLVEAAAAAGDLPVIAGTGCESTAETVALTLACAQRGAQAALVVTPHYYGGRMDPAALEAHFTAVADAVPIPLILYNVPKFTHVHLTPVTVSRLARHPNIIGIKDSSGNVSQLADILERVPDDFRVLVGTAGVLYGALSLGCPGGVLALANVAPEACLRLQRLVSDGEHAAAAALQRRLVPVNQAVTATYGIPGLKAALDMLGYYGGDPRPPLRPATDEQRGQIEVILKTAGLLP